MFERIPDVAVFLVPVVGLAFQFVVMAAAAYVGCRIALRQHARAA